MRLILPKKSFFIFLIVLFLSIEGFSQTTGDYRSAGTGDWTTLASWQRWNGTSWVTPSGTSPQGYPGQYSGTGAILIQSGHTISVSDTGISTQSMGTLTVSGKIILNGKTNATISFSFNTQTVIVTPYTGEINFQNKISFILPSTATLQVIRDTSLNPDYLGLSGDCNHNQDIYIGTSVYAYCNGGGSTGLTFQEVMAGGGTINAIPSSNSPVCQGNPVSLFGSYTGVIGSAVSYSWLITDPNGGTTTTNTQNPIISNPIVGTYVARLTCSTIYNSSTYSNSETIQIIVNSSPTLATIAGGAATVCVNSATPAFTNTTTGGTWSITNGTGTASITAGGIVTGLTVGNVTVVYSVSNGTCSNAVTKSLTVNSLPVQPALSSVTQPSCSVSTGSFTITNYNASYIYSATPSTGVVISGSTITAPTGSYTITATLGSCSSIASNSVTVNAQPVTPVQPTLSTVTHPTCSVATGSFTILNYNGSYTYSIAPSTGVSISSGTVTAPEGSYIVTAISGSCSSIASNSVTVNAQPATPVQPVLSTVTHPTCSVAIGSFTITNYNASYTYSATPSTGVSISGNTVTAPVGSYTITAILGSCSSIASNSVTVNNQPLTPSTPIAGTPTNPSCKVPTGSVPLSGLPSTGTIVQTGTKDDTYTLTAGDGGAKIITGLHPGTYYFAVSNGSCVSNTVTVVIIAPETNTWSSSGWSDGTPTINQRLVFGTDYTNANDVDLLGCSCQVTGSTVVTIKSGRTLKIENGVEVQPNATLIFENNASLVQINDAAVNLGNINYKRHTAPVKRYDFTYWSSPVAGQMMKALSPNTLGDKYYSYNPTSGWKIEYNGGVLPMEPGKGYIIRAPQTFSITVPAIDTNPVFVGVPNNGLVSFSIAANQTHLLGNPYPSAIDADKFIAANSTSLEGTLYFWTHNTSPSKDIAGDAIYNYTTNDYITYNKTGGVNVATGKIAAGQGFFAPASAAGGTIVFNNAMRYTEGQPNYNNSNFLKINSASKTVTTTTATEKNRVWLNLTNSEGAFKQTLLGYITGATNGYDAGYDGVSYDGNQFVDFYSVNNAVNLSIQGRALPFVKQDSVVLGYKSTIKGEFKISIDHTDGALSTQNIFLEDKDLKVLHDLKQGAYTFNTEKGIFNNRFVLRYVDKNAVEPVVETPVVETPVVETPVIDSSVTVSVKQDQITVSSSEDLISKIIIYDVAGKIIYQKEDVSANDFMIQNLLSSKQVLLVTLVLENGKTTSTKIVY